MKHFLFTLIVLFLASCNSNTIYEGTAGNLSINIDKTGKLVSLKDTKTGVDYIAKEPSYLMLCSKYGANDKLEAPVAATCTDGKHIQLTYPNGITLTVLIEPKDSYFRMEVVKADPVKEASQVKWGPYYTNMQSFIGAWLGIVRSDDFSIGVLSLDSNTDTPSVLSEAAAYTKEGALLQLSAFDHTRGLFRDYSKEGKEDKLRRSEPISQTVEGSAVALYSSCAGYEEELNAIEKVELAEGLPHPTINGVWNKRSRMQTKYNLWSDYTEKNFDEYLDLTKKIGAHVMCLFHGFSKNWGHFDVDEKKFPSGIPGLYQMSQKAKKWNIGTTLYTLTTFTKPRPELEPYIAPVPDNRLQSWRYEGQVAKDIKADDDCIVIKNDPNVLATLKRCRNIRIDNEMIRFAHHEADGDKIILSKCERGFHFTDKKAHKADSNVKLMYFAGFNNFYPGTIDMTVEISNQLFKNFYEADHKLFIADGFESCLEAGYGCLAGNKFIDNFHQKCVDNKKEIYATAANFSNYSWHHYSHMSWGEFDWGHGFRGSMLDYRIGRQVDLSSCLMPKKLGQYYPDRATVADIEWLMAFAAGWDSGIDFVLNTEIFNKNKEYNQILERLALWTKAKDEKAFTEEQLRDFRQTDRQYTLSQNADGSWKVDFVGYWKYDKLKLLPSSSLPVKSLSNATVKPCSIDWFWTHNPGTYDEVMLSDDMIHSTGETPSDWEIHYPDYTEPKGAYCPTDNRYFQYVLRLPDDAPCAIKDIVLTFNGYEIVLPVTLQPGEYLTMPHIIPQLCIYDKAHKLLTEKRIRGHVPFVRKGEKATLKISCTPVEKGAKTNLIMNIRNQNGFFK